MKLKNILAISCAVFMLSLLAGCDCDVPRVYDFNKNITVDRSNIEVDPGGNGVSHIIEGNGNYTLRSTNETVAKANLEGNKINIQGLSSGKASIIITDSKKVNAIINILVYSELVIDGSTFEMPTNGSKLVKIISGNGGYRIDSPDNLKTSIEQNPEGTFIKFTSDDTEVKDIPITIYDRTGRSANITMTVSEPVRFEFKGHIKMNDIDNTPNMAYYNKVDGGKRLYGWKDTSKQYFWMYIRFPDGDFSVGTKSDAEIWFDFYSAPSGDISYINGWAPLNELKITKNDGERIWINFNYKGTPGIAVQKLP